jgi:hypothetical protein
MEGRLREHRLVRGNWQDSLLYSILAHEWQNLSAHASARCFLSVADIFATLAGRDSNGAAMTFSRLIGVLVFALLSNCVRIDADLKAVFTFNDRIVSIRFPELNYGIVTAVDENTRKIAITYPTPRAEATAYASPPHLEITLEPLASNVSGADYYEHYLRRYVETMGSTSAPVDESRSGGFALLDCTMTFLFFNDSELRAHKALLITSIDNGVGVVILLDTLADQYSANENVSTGILQSIQFEK